jgi:hypothetical protein
MVSLVTGGKRKAVFWPLQLSAYVVVQPVKMERFFPGLPVGMINLSEKDELSVPTVSTYLPR